MASNPLSNTIDRKDPRYELLKRSRNARFPATDAEAAGRIVICNNADDIVDALQRIVSSGIRPTVRSGGHCYEDFVVNNPNGALIDLSLQNAIGSGPAPYSVASGATLGEIYTALYKRSSVTIPGGSCPSVGAGGHISGGGYGLLSRLQGLTCDWVTGIDIVAVEANGKVVLRHTDKDHDPDLFRACRGAGGGNFGIITNFYFEKLPPAPVEVAEAGISFAWVDMTEAKFTKIVTRFGEYWAGRGKDPDTWGLFSILNLSPATLNDRVGFSVQFCNPDGTAKDLTVMNEFFDRFSDLGPEPYVSPHVAGGGWRQQEGSSPPIRPLPRAGTYRSYMASSRPWIEATVNLGSGGYGRGFGGSGQRAKYKSSYMKETFTPQECATIYKFLTSSDYDPRGTTLAVDSYGGAVNNLDRVQDTAIPQRASQMKLQYLSFWRDADDDVRRLKFMDDFYTAVYTGDHVPAEYQGTPMGTRFEGCYMNYCDVDMLRYKYWPQLYYGTGDLYPFLQRVKRRYDPNNIFHHAMSIRT